MFNDGDVAALLAHPDALLLDDKGVTEGRTRVATSTHDHVVGFATTRAVDAVLELEDLFVDPDWMRRGIGRGLVRDTMTVAAHQHIRRVEVTANPHALAFYGSVGFVCDGDVKTPFGTATRMHLDVARHGGTSRIVARPVTGERPCPGTGTGSTA